MVGISHRGASLSLLERVAVRREDRPDLRAALRTIGCGEAVLLSTCSRVEIYLGHASPGESELVTMLLEVLAEHSGATHHELGAVVEVRTGQAAVGHLFDVTAGLQSRLLGEVEILAQTRSAFRESQASGMTGPVLGRLFPAALRSGRRVHAATSLGGYARSLGHQAVDVGLASLGGRPDPVVLVVGSGQMARAAVDHLAGLGVRPTVAARDEVYAARLAGPGAVCPLPALARGIAEADLLICATSASQHVVTVAHVSRAMAGRTNPLTVVDLSVPRNVDAAVAAVPGVTLIDVEGLADDGTAAPAMAAALSTAAAMASAAAEAFGEGVAARDAGPVIAALRLRVEHVCLAELVKSVGWGAVDPEALTRSAHAIAGKLLHRPTIAARQAASAGDVDGLRQLCDMFGVPPADVGLAESGGQAQHMAG
ncbi:glutamyl-tRNA reductase [Lapillicoccus sp.]|uniref:glutamyl-tRNA reductase n=1 Tax=Lapillicoccus sp. TaxID=1909287 RepID=UPI003983A329